MLACGSVSWMLVDRGGVGRVWRALALAVGVGRVWGALAMAVWVGWLGSGWCRAALFGWAVRYLRGGGVCGAGLCTRWYVVRQVVMEGCKCSQEFAVPESYSS